MKKLTLTLVLLVFASPLFAAITRVQSAKANSAAGTVTSQAVVLGAAPTNGNIVVVAAAVIAGAAGAAQIAPSSGITWTKIDAAGTSSEVVSLFIGRVYTGASATITVTLNPGSIAVVAAEYSGVSALVDRAAVATGTSTTADSGATSATQVANELCVAAIGHRIASGATFSAPGGGFTIVDQDKTSVGSSNDRSVALLENIVSTTGTQDASATISISGIWSVALATLQPATTAAAQTSRIYGQ